MGSVRGDSLQMGEMLVPQNVYEAGGAIVTHRLRKGCRQADDFQIDGDPGGGGDLGVVPLEERFGLCGQRGGSVLVDKMYRSRFDETDGMVEEVKEGRHETGGGVKEEASTHCVVCVVPRCWRFSGESMTTSRRRMAILW